MSLYFSAATGGFYHAAVHGESMPVDVVAITVETHEALLAAQAEGKQIIAGPDGQPLAAEREAPPPDLAAFARAALAASDITLMRCIEADVAVPQAWRDYRAALRAVIADAASYTTLPDRPAYPAGT
jgi:hypothetical protein